jgi:hypothetical protein
MPSITFQVLSQEASLYLASFLLRSSLLITNHSLHLLDPPARINRKSLVERQKALTTYHFDRQLDPFALPRTEIDQSASRPLIDGGHGTLSVDRQKELAVYIQMTSS